MKDTIKAVITAVIADAVGAEADHVHMDEGDIVKILDRDVHNVVDSYVAVSGERPCSWLPTRNPPVRFETRFYTRIWCAPEEFRIEYSVRDHEDGRYDDLLCSWENVSMTWLEFIAHVRETAKKLGIDIGDRIT